MPTQEQITNNFINNLQHPKYYQNDAVGDYAMLIVYTYTNNIISEFDWSQINQAIIAKWSESELERIKTQAWKMLKIK